MRKLKDITPREVDQFIEDFNIKGLFTLAKLKKQMSLRKEYIDKYGDVETYDNTRKVMLHRDKWYEITPDNLSQASLMLSEKGVLYHTTNSQLILYKVASKKVYVHIEPFKKSPSLFIGTFGINKHMLPYFEYFAKKGFCAIVKRILFLKNGLIDIKYEEVKI